jgi:hypothetical protein
MNPLGDLKHEIVYNDFGNGAIRVWYENIPEVVSISFYGPEFGDQEHLVVNKCQRNLHFRLREIQNTLKGDI